MKFVAKVLLLLCFSNSVFGQCDSCTINIYSNTSQDFNLNNGDRLCIHSGTEYTGEITQIHSNAVICIADSAIFQPSILTNWNGIIYNHGTIDLSSVSIKGNGQLHNIDGEIIMSDPYANGTPIISNEDGSSIQIIGDISLTGNTTLTNDGDLYISGNFELGGSAGLENNGKLEIEGEFDLKKNIENHGYLRIKGDFIDNGNGIHNFCKLVFDNSFTSRSNDFINEGLIWMIGIGGTEFVNEDVFHQTPGAQFRGIDFVNLGELTGAGSYYFSGSTTNEGDIGNDALGINFYDATPLDTAYILDYENEPVDPSVTNNLFVPADTSSWDPGPPADAGPDQWICKDFTTLSAEASEGKWSLKTGFVEINDVYDPQSAINDIALGTNVLTWNERASCGATPDEVIITYEIADTTIWMGAIDNNWHEHDNWTDCIPGKTTVAIIPNTFTKPQINPNKTGYALKVFMEQFSELRIRFDAALKISEP